MSSHSNSNQATRELTHTEYELSEWLLRNGDKDNTRYLSQLKNAQVSGTCNCGCASVDFTISGKPATHSQGLEVLSDFLWRSEAGNLMGVFVFAEQEQLAGLEVWSVDGEETPTSLPEPRQLVSWQEGRNA